MKPMLQSTGTLLLIDQKLGLSLRRVNRANDSTERQCKPLAAVQQVITPYNSTFQLGPTLSAEIMTLFFGQLLTCLISLHTTFTCVTAHWLLPGSQSV